VQKSKQSFCFSIFNFEETVTRTDERIVGKLLQKPKGAFFGHEHFLF
jgi:hypothetical protein